jgi:hypothetical protein
MPPTPLLAAHRPNAASFADRGKRRWYDSAFRGDVKLKGRIRCFAKAPPLSLPPTRSGGKRRKERGLPQSVI